MKRKEIIELLDKTTKEIDAIDEATVRNNVTGEVKDVVGKREFEAMQCALIFCKHLISGDYNPVRALKFIDDMVSAHVNAHIEAEQRREDANECPDFRRKEAGESESTGEDDGARS